MTDAISAVVYCDRWHSKRHQPMDVLTETAARRRDGQGEAYTVLLSDDTRPHTYLDINWSLDYLAVWFLDDRLRRHLKYGFSRIDPSTLFLDAVIHWDYPEDAPSDLRRATTITSYRYERDGIAHETIADTVAQTEKVTSYSDVALVLNWEPVPVFGDWVSVARKNREPE